MVFNKAGDLQKQRNALGMKAIASTSIVQTRYKHKHIKIDGSKKENYGMTKVILNKLIVHSFIVIGCFTILYVIGYFVLMDRNNSAYDDNGNKLYITSYIFAQNIRVRGDLSVYARGYSWFNTIYFPMDIIYSSIYKADSNPKRNTGNR